MYASYFGLTEPPFSISPDPRYLYMSKRHREAMAHLIYGMQEGGGFVQLTGEVGTGKTTLCRCLMQQLPDNVDVALILNPQINQSELLGTLCDELHIPYAEDATPKKHLDTLNQYLLKAHAEGRKTVLVIDEAQLLTRTVLEQVRILTNLETTKHKLLQIILIGQPELSETLGRSDLRQLSQRITARYHLEPLNLTDTKEYVKHRMAVAGGHRPLFSNAAMRQLYKFSNGVPRIINVICDRALLGAYAENRSLVSREMLHEAALEVLGGAAAAGTRHWQWLIPTVALVPLLLLVPQIRDTVFEYTEKFQLTLGSNTAADSAAGDSVIVDSVASTGVTVGDGVASGTRSGGDLSGGMVTSNAANSDVMLNNRVNNEDPQGPRPIAQRDPVTVAAVDVGAGENSGNVPPQSLTRTDALPVQPALVTTSQTPIQTTSTVANLDGAIPKSRIANPDLPTSPNLDLITPENSPDLSPRETEDKGSFIDIVRSNNPDNYAEVFSTLTTIWGFQYYPENVRTGCKAIAAQGLRCLEKQGTWNNLRSYNRPALLTIRGGGETHHVLVKSLGPKNATLNMGEQEYTYDVTKIDPYWYGEFLMLWRPPPIKGVEINATSWGPDVLWLRQTLNRVAEKEGASPVDVTTARYDEGLQQRVREFQVHNDLSTDGVVGSETMIQLNTILQDANTPLLVPTG